MCVQQKCGFRRLPPPTTPVRMRRHQPLWLGKQKQQPRMRRNRQEMTPQTIRQRSMFPRSQAVRDASPSNKPHCYASGADICQMQYHVPPWQGARAMQVEAAGAAAEGRLRRNLSPSI